MKWPWQDSFLHYDHNVQREKLIASIQAEPKASPEAKVVDLPKAIAINENPLKMVENSQSGRQAQPKENRMANEFVTILEKIGKDFELGLAEAVKYLPAASVLASCIFPAAVAPLATASTVANLLQTAVAEAEQKLAAAGVQTGTGPQKLATVLTIVTSAVTELLAQPAIAEPLQKSGITVNSAYITNLVNAVVSFLNVQGVVTVA